MREETIKNSSLSTSSRVFLGLLILLAMWGKPQIADAQVVLYMEIMTQEKPIKYYAGQDLMFKSAQFPDEWQTITIERLMDEEKIILYDGGMINMSDITHIRRTRPWAKAIGYMLQTFGWLGSRLVEWHISQQVLLILE